MFQDLTKKLIL